MRRPPLATALDTHEHYKRLRDAGFDEAQAEALLALRVDQLGELVTKDYLRAELETFRNEIDARLRAFEEQLREMERRYVRYLVTATTVLAVWITVLRFLGL